LDALRGLRAIYVDAGIRDEWYLDLGALAIRDALTEIGVTHVACDLFDAAHGGLEYRYPRGLATSRDACRARRDVGRHRQGLSSLAISRSRNDCIVGSACSQIQP
jgi:hypothetical protein